MSLTSLIPLYYVSIIQYINSTLVSLIDDKPTEIASRSLDANSQHMFLKAQSINEEAIESGGRALWNDPKEWL
jgi:hypothetical protein